MKKMLIVILLSLSPFIVQKSFAQDAMLGEIKWVPYNFAPRGWALCSGQILPISQHSALFSLLGTTFGGDGRSTFALPDMRGRVMVHAGQGPGLSNYRLGQNSGVETVTLTESEIPSHTHGLNGSTDTAAEKTPDGNFLASKMRTNIYTSDDANLETMNSGAVGNAGGSQPHENRQPSLTLNCIIALVGVFPSRS